MPHGSSGIAGVDIGVDEPVKSHCRRTRPDHGHNNPQNLPSDSGSDEAIFPPRQHRAGERERQSKDRVLEPDHLQCQQQLSDQTDLMLRDVGQWGCNFIFPCGSYW